VYNSTSSNFAKKNLATKEKKRILTGDRPTGKLHLGHYVGSLMNRVKLQREYETFIIIADVQALTTHWREPERIRQAVFDVALDNLAVGIDPEITTLCVQSMIPEIAELTVLYGLFTNMNKLRHNPTTKAEALQYGMIGENSDLMTGFDQLTYGFFGYPVSQAADITFVRAHLVPVGEDQKPHIELCRDIVLKFNELYGKGKEIIPMPEALISDIPRLTALDGSAKMSKSLGNVINLSDEREEIEKMVWRAVTDPQKIRKNDKGHPEICNVYKYHRIFNTKENSDIVERDCKSGALGCVECKGRLTEVLDNLLAPIREKRKEYEAKMKDVEEILREGTKRARAEGQETVRLVKEALKIDYFPLPKGFYGI